MIFFVTDKRRVKKSIKTIQRVKTWQLLILLIVACLIAATFLRLNNIGMVERRTAVHVADEYGSEDGIKNSLYSLQRHASAHMNASTGAIYLEDSYNRAVKKAIAQARERDAGNDVYTRADETCQQQFSGYSQAYVQCFAAELDKYPAGSLQDEAELPNPELYRHEFSSPLWTPDFAGWSVLVCALIVLVIIVRLISLAVLKLLIRRHYDAL